MRGVWKLAWLSGAMMCCLQAQVQTRDPLPITDAKEQADLGSLLEQAMAGSRVPGMAALLLRNGGVAEVASRGLRRAGREEHVSKEDTWVIGSTGKPMTVAVIARLVEKGVLSWDAPLSQMLPELANQMQPAYRPVTLLQLLSHRSGLPENLRAERALETFFQDSRPFRVQRLELVRAALREEPVVGGGFAYCNTGFLVAACIAEGKTGVPFEELTRREVFEPLGMTSAGFGPPSGDHQPVGHQKGQPMDRPLHLDDGVPAMYGPAGFMHMSIQDWGRFCADQLLGSVGKGKLLKAETYRLMQSAQPGSPAGVDWGVQTSMGGRRGPVLIHGGSDGNWLAWVVLFPEQQSGALVVANAAEDMGADKVERALLAALLPRLAPTR